MPMAKNSNTTLNKSGVFVYSIAVIKTMTKRNFEEEEFISAYSLQFTSAFMKESQGRN